MSLEDWLIAQMARKKAECTTAPDAQARDMIAGEIQGYRLTLTHLMYGKDQDE